MNILFYSTFSNQSQWLKVLNKKFKGYKIFTISDNKIDFTKIEVAIIWNIPNSIIKKLPNLKIIFSLGAGVDHILRLSDYKKTPIVRSKDPNMRIRMFNHVLSQILNYQLKLFSYQKSQKKKIWLEQKETPLNKDITIGVLGLGYIGEFVADRLLKLNYKIVGFKNIPSNSKKKFKIFFTKQISNFISSSNIIVSILPSTRETENFINKKFLNKMKKNSLLINIGRGSALNEKDLINHIKSNKNFYASLDVFKKEPLNKNNKLWNYSNITITPHVAAITDIESSLNYIYTKLQYFSKKNKFKSDIDLKKGY